MFLTLRHGVWFFFGRIRLDSFSPQAANYIKSWSTITNNNLPQIITSNRPISHMWHSPWPCHTLLPLVWVCWKRLNEKYILWNNIKGIKTKTYQYFNLVAIIDFWLLGVLAICMICFFGSFGSLLPVAISTQQTPLPVSFVSLPSHEIHLPTKTLRLCPTSLDEAFWNSTQRNSTQNKQHSLSKQKEYM